MQKRCGTGIKNSIETEWTRNDLRARRRPESIPQRGPCRVDAELQIRSHMRMEEEKKKQYQQYVKEVTPTHNLWVLMIKAFITGGIICVIGQGILNYCMNGLGMDKQTAGSWCSLMLVLCSVILTGFNIYPQITKWGGAGALVPITGFANSVAAPAIEFKKEGQVFGIGCKIFTIAGPVILYGILSSWILGILYWAGGLAGIF